MFERKEHEEKRYLQPYCNLPEISDNEVIDSIMQVPEHYSANTVVDIGNTCLFVNSVSDIGLSGATGVVGRWVDLSNADTFCNVYIAVGPCSGPLQFQVQTAAGPNDIPATNSFSGNIFSGGAPASGSFFDPTSGLAQLPTWFTSGGLLTVNSGFYTNPGQCGASGQLVNNYTQFTLPFGPNPVQNAQGGNVFIGSGSVQAFASGGIAFAAFQRNYQYARINLISGNTIPPYIQAGFVTNLMTTGSGGGYTQQPFSTSFVNV